MQRAGWHAAAMTARVTDIDQRATRLYKETLYENHEFDKYLVFGLTTQRSKQLHRMHNVISVARPHAKVVHVNSMETDTDGLDRTCRNPMSRRATLCTSADTLALSRK